MQAGDVIALEAQLADCTIKQSGVDEATKLRTLECDYESVGQLLSQLGDKLFTVTLIAKRGAQFEKLKPQAVAIARSTLA